MGAPPHADDIALSGADFSPVSQQKLAKVIWVCYLQLQRAVNDKFDIAIMASKINRFILDQPGESVGLRVNPCRPLQSLVRVPTTFQLRVSTAER